MRNFIILNFIIINLLLSESNLFYAFVESKLNIREAPSINSKIVCFANKNEDIKRLDENEKTESINGFVGKWIKVKCPNQKGEGYAFSSYISKIKLPNPTQNLIETCLNELYPKEMKKINIKNTGELSAILNIKLPNNVVYRQEINYMAIQETLEIPFGNLYQAKVIVNYCTMNNFDNAEINEDQSSPLSRLKIRFDSEKLSIENFYGD
ncbi:SH3 domain-containing protein [Leptospira kanakyensis]|uniref:SH3 domain-containing protein n=1 Tax=Leptospira kanakyensis TaxID=2484968 RepID=UPI00223E7C0A|nr:SH3 domain-containing protein [Leptospira kanakyensis]MCW7483223.1 SH3 domain-containing protein [Leptospira kanakyensis]